MRVALISDLHANEVALSAVFRHIQRHGVDETICLGDVATLGPHPREVLDILKLHSCPCIMGNHDEFLLDAQLINSYTEAPVVKQAVDWCRAQLRPADFAFLRSFQTGLERSLDGRTQLSLFHGSPRSHMENLLATTPPEELDALLGERRSTVMAGGHTHLQMIRQHRGTLLVNPGSVGMPFREFANGQAPRVLPHAEYAIVSVEAGELSVQLQRVELDRAALRQATVSVEHPLAAGLLANYA
jgi:predicted phosphodiesterase